MTYDELKSYVRRVAPYANEIRAWWIHNIDGGDSSDFRELGVRITFESREIRDALKLDDEGLVLEGKFEYCVGDYGATDFWIRMEAEWMGDKVLTDITDIRRDLGLSKWYG